MDILSVAGFALNVYSYMKEHVVEEKRSGVPIEQVAVLKEHPVSPRMAQKEPLSNASQTVAVRHLLKGEVGKQKLDPSPERAVSVSGDMKSSAQQTGNKHRRHVLLSQQRRAIDSGVDQRGRYYLIRKAPSVKGEREGG